MSRLPDKVKTPPTLRSQLKEKKEVPATLASALRQAPADFGAEILTRYGDQDLRPAIAADFKMEAPVTTLSKVPSDRSAEYAPAFKQINIAPDMRPDINLKGFAENLGHEMVHAADDFHDGYMGVGSGHFNYFPAPDYDQEEALGKMLKEQRLIEQGFPADRDVLLDQPWLKDVTPLSSQPLRTPWSMREALRQKEDPQWEALKKLPAEVKKFK